jgi:hypothetical protein
VADITDAQGRALDGKDNGQAGSNFLAVFGQGGLTFAKPSAIAVRQQLLHSAVDALLPSVKPRREVR